MMNPVEREKQNQQRWRTRFAQGRAGLSTSLEETLANSTGGEEEREDCDEAGELSMGLDANNSLLVRPRLSLQSKPLPVVRVPPQPNAPAGVIDSSPLPPETAQPAAKKKRLAGRNTRVELRAMPKPEKKAGRKTTPLAERSTEAQGTPLDSAAPVKEVVTESSSAVKAAHARIPPREKLSGKGVVRKGSAEAIVQNAHVTNASVVLASLLGNPGKVVTHYYTLLPGYGFTLHLSDAASADTPFNYVILLGELF